MDAVGRLAEQTVDCSQYINYLYQFPIIEHDIEMDNLSLTSSDLENIDFNSIDFIEYYFHCSGEFKILMETVEKYKNKVNSFYIHRVLEDELDRIKQQCLFIYYNHTNLFNVVSNFIIEIHIIPKKAYSFEFTFTHDTKDHVHVFKLTPDLTECLLNEQQSRSEQSLRKRKRVCRETTEGD
jgi:hypothetical protein